MENQKQNRKHTKRSAIPKTRTPRFPPRFGVSWMIFGRAFLVSVLESLDDFVFPEGIFNI